ncbi:MULTISPECIES: hypothetical protein [Paraburkholderia]|nr:hypothetical protein [Paraburkholderia podalyriae]
MTIDEAAKHLFVSPAHVRRLLELGELLAVPGHDGGEVTINLASTKAYRAKLEAAWQGYTDSEKEGNDPLGRWQQ